jgi:hypothetical protein
MTAMLQTGNQFVLVVIRPPGEPLIIVVGRNPSSAGTYKELSILPDEYLPIRAIDFFGYDTLSAHASHFVKLKKICH